MGGEIPGVQQLLGEGQLQKGVQPEVDRGAAQGAQDAAQDIVGAFEADVLFLKGLGQEKAQQHAEGGVVIAAGAVEKAGQGREEQHRVKGRARQPAAQPGHQQHHDQAQGPAAEHVGRIVGAHYHPGKAHQQRQQNGQHPEEPVLLFVGGQGAVEGHGAGGVAAGEGIALGRHVHDVGVRLDLAQQLDFVAGKIGPQPQGDVLDHRVPHAGHQHVHAHILAEFLVPAPVQKAHDQHQKQLFPKGGETAQNREQRSLAANGALQPLHQADLPVEEEIVAQNRGHGIISFLI